MMKKTLGHYRIEKWIDENLHDYPSYTLVYVNPNTIWFEDNCGNTLSITHKGHNRLIFKDIEGHIPVPGMKAKK